MLSLLSISLSASPTASSLLLCSERASGSVVALAVARLPASVRPRDRNASVAPGAEACVCGCACVCVKVCVCFSMTRSETIRAASSALSPVSVCV